MQPSSYCFYFTHCCIRGKGRKPSSNRRGERSKRSEGGARITVLYTGALTEEHTGLSPILAEETHY